MADGAAGADEQTRLALLQHFPTPEDVYYAEAEEVLLTEGITREQAILLENKDCAAADRILADCQRLNVNILTLQDAGYPNRLRNIYDPPCLLYVRGRLPAFDDEAAVAVVGTRDCTPYGVSCAEKLGHGLAAGGAVVVSGLARGIDSAALRGALRAGGTVAAVLGNGTDVIYPPENQYLYEDVAAAGALVSEYPPGTPPDGRHFPVRNRTYPASLWQPWWWRRRSAAVRSSRRAPRWSRGGTCSQSPDPLMLRAAWAATA